MKYSDDSLLNSHPLITPPDDDQVMREFTYQSASVLHLDWIDKFHTANCSCLSPRISMAFIGRGITSYSAVVFIGHSNRLLSCVASFLPIIIIHTAT